MPPDTNKPGVPGGVTEACLYNDHSMCNNPRCGCTCHQRASQVDHSNGAPASLTETGPEKSCPKCGVKRPFHETFCRIDGERLSSLACTICGRGREPEDKFCFNCGSPSTAESKAELPHVVNIPTVPQTQTEEQPAIDYAKQVLEGLQKEGLDVSQSPQGLENANQQVVERPAGSQGSFKLVNRPNPNKVRVPAGGKQAAGPSTQGSKFKLPIKPS